MTNKKTKFDTTQTGIQTQITDSDTKHAQAKRPGCNPDFQQCKYCVNTMVKEEPVWDSPGFSFLKSSDMLDFHRSIDGYSPTPLVELPEAAKYLGLKNIFVKDESHRFGIKAFKAFGASYAIYRFLKSRWEEGPGKETGIPFNPQSFKDASVIKKLGTFTFCAATDGNHGRAVAWTANKLKQKAIIYMPDNTAPARIQNIRDENAEVELVPGTFDDCVEKCAADAKANGWQAISDTAYQGYMEIPKYIMLGYTSIFHELMETFHTKEDPEIDIVLLPAGVGGIAAAGTAFYTMKYGKRRPLLVCVEPSDCDCFLESVRYGNGEPLPTRGKQTSMMVGLNCGIPSPVAWPIIRDAMHLFIGVTDDYAIEAMKMYHREGVVSGESGSAGLAGLIALMKDSNLEAVRKQFHFGPQSRVLLINTEGDTDPVKYREIIFSR